MPHLPVLHTPVLTLAYAVEEKFKRDGGDESDSESSSESEDEDAFLATEDLDTHISKTLHALKTKDPSIYDKDVKFFPQDTTGKTPEKKEKPMFLKDYHRERYLAGAVGGSDAEEDGEEEPKTYVQEQADLKKSIVAEINAAADSEDEEEGDFLKPKEKAKKSKASRDEPSKQTLTENDIAQAADDPETYLSNFMAARAWAAADGSNWQAFDSDDGDSDDDRAEEVEAAYNMRFEDPTKSNEVLKSYARDVAAQKSVRRDEKTGRRRQRELEKQRKEEEKQARRDEKARLKKLKLEEAEGKLQRIRATAGMGGKKLSDDELVKILEDAWEDDKWEDEMKRRFGEEYYAEDDDDVSSRDGEDEEAEGEDKKKKKKPKKPKWDDDIDITDVVGDYEEDEAPAFTLSDAEDEGQDGAAEAEEEEDDDEDERPAKKRKTKDHKREREVAKRAAKKSRQALDAIVATNVELETHPALPSASGGFRWRETSPRAFGLSTNDILLAPSDTALNQYAGLKKYASWRDPDAKRKDKKRLGKKARLRKWRRETFGKGFEDGPVFEGAGEEAEPMELDVDVGEKEKKKRKRKRGHKKGEEEV